MAIRHLFHYHFCVVIVRGGWITSPRNPMDIFFKIRVYLGGFSGRIAVYRGKGQILSRNIKNCGQNFKIRRTNPHEDPLFLCEEQSLNHLSTPPRWDEHPYLSKQNLPWFSGKEHWKKKTLFTSALKKYSRRFLCKCRFCCWKRDDDKNCVRDLNSKPPFSRYDRPGRFRTVAVIGALLTEGFGSEQSLRATVWRLLQERVCS